MKAIKNHLRGMLLPAAVAALLAAPTSAGACTSEGPTHNAYLFSAFNRNLMWDSFAARTDRFWQQYVDTDNKDLSFQYSSDDILRAAQQKGDKEMEAYVRWLQTYLKDNQLFAGWDYPTSAQLQQRTVHLRQMTAAAANYRGTRLRQQYALLRMRALFALKQYKQTVAYWQTTARKLAPSVYRERMENIYAGALLRLGNKLQAEDIYARQQDYNSLKYCVRNYRNLAGIKKVYLDNPNSATLTYLVQDFVNNTQETMDALADRYATAVASPSDSDLVSSMRMIDARMVYRQDAEQFLAFARQVLKEGKTKDACLWQSAMGCVDHLLGRYDAAKQELTAALAMSGTQRMKDNARAILAVNDVHTEPFGQSFYALMARHLQWLDKLSAAEGPQADYTANHYEQVKDRLIYRNLVPLLRQKGQQALALALIGVANRDQYVDTQWPNLYDNDYFDGLQQLSPEDLIGYYGELRSAPKNDLEAYAFKQVALSDDYYNDLIGTKLLANGRFQEAIPYLEKVSLGFLGKQNIAPYAARRSWSVDRWMKKQPMPENFYDNGRADSVALTTNKKLDFCRAMAAEQSLYLNMHEGMERRQQAYKLASLYYQASYEGDCWWLTQYGVSVGQDSALNGTKDFVAEAIGLLEPLSQPYSLSIAIAQAPNKKEAKAIKNSYLAQYGKGDGSERFSRDVLDLQQKSLYALAFIHRDPWYYTGWDDETEQWYNLNNLRVCPSARQYKALEALSAFTVAHPTMVASYVSHCDVLKKFEAGRKG